MKNLIFEPEKHKYFLDGRELPPVSKILQHFGISNFFFVNPATLEQSQRFGNAVHLLTKLYDQNDLGEYDSQLEPWLNGYKKFLEAFSPEWQVIEEPMASTIWGFAGTPDRFGVMRGKNVILDIKTGGDQPSHKLQTAGYQILIEENLNIKVKERYSLILLPDDFRLVTHELKCEVSIFKGLVQAYTWKQNNKLIKENNHD